MTDELPSRNNLHLAHRTRRYDQVAFLFRNSEPAHIMLLLRKARKALEHDLDSADEETDRVAIVGAVCKLADTTARFAGVALAPKGTAAKPGDNARPVLPMES